VAGWENVYNDPSIWHFRFKCPRRKRTRTQAHLLRLFLERLTKHTPSPKPIAWPTPRRTRVQDQCTPAGPISFLSSRPPKTSPIFPKLKLTLPVLAIGGEKANGAVLGQQMKIVATDANEIVLKDTGHWVLEERPKKAPMRFLNFVTPED